MKVPFRLFRTEESATADAALLLDDDPAKLARLGSMRPFPTVFRVDGGFVLFASAPFPPGVLKLRRLGGDLFVPVDAQLLPRLLPDEIVGLTRDRGLVVLVNAVLAFDPKRPLRPDEWLRPAMIVRRTWSEFPTPPDRPERLTTIERPSPPGAILEILSAGQPDDAEPLAGTGGVPEDARPGAGTFIAGLGAGMLLGAAQFATWLGRQLNAPGLAKFGGSLASKAIQKVPRITEKILGAQEAALREVLRQLQSGDVERALKRAPSAYADPSKSSPISASADLGRRDPRFSLRDLIAGGGAGTWLGGGDVWEQLAQEYRLLAAEASRRGDARRAAYLYGVLLRDLRSAANALLAGCYFRDAAILYRDKLGDTAAAATAFERGGDYDEAVRLYDRRGEFEAAAELLRFIGDEDRAVEYFERAVGKLKDGGHWCAAGDLLRGKLGRQRPATDCFREGWRRGGSGHLKCGERLIDDLLATEAWTEFDELLDEAARAYPPPESAPASQFFNYALSLREFLPADRREPVRDRVQLHFARHLRANVGTVRHATDRVRELFDAKGGWTGPQVRDAEYAVRAKARRMIGESRPSTGLPPAGRVSAVAVARTSRDLVLTVDNTVSVWHSQTGETVPVKQFRHERVLGVASNDDASIVHVLYADGEGVHLRCYANRTDLGGRLPAYLAQGQAWIAADIGEDGNFFLQASSSVRDGEPSIALRKPGGRADYQGLYLRERMESTTEDNLFGPKLFLLAHLGPAEEWEWDENFVRHAVGGQVRRWVVNWEPGVPDDSPLLRSTVDWMAPFPNQLQIVGVTKGGLLIWCDFDDSNPDNPKLATVHATDAKGIDAACLLGRNIVAAANRDGEIGWLSVAGGRLVPFARPTALGIPSRVVFLASGRTRNEVLAVFADGTVLRVPAP